MNGNTTLNDISRKRAVFMRRDARQPHKENQGQTRIKLPSKTTIICGLPFSSQYRGDVPHRRAGS
jgi:hypothetical protein